MGIRGIRWEFVHDEEPALNGVTLTALTARERSRMSDIFASASSDSVPLAARRWPGGGIDQMATFVFDKLAEVEVLLVGSDRRARRDNPSRAYGERWLYVAVL